MYLGNENYYYLVDKEDYSISKDEGNLFYCQSEDTACTELYDIGYFVMDKDTIYSCREGRNGIECSRSEVTEQDDTCNAASIGKIFLNQGKLSICLNYDNEKDYFVELNVSNSGNYIIGKDSSNLFGLSNEKYAIVNIKDKIVTIHRTYQNNLKYVYANMSNKLKIFEKGDTCPTDISNLLELDCFEGKCKDVVINP